MRGLGAVNSTPAPHLMPGNIIDSKVINLRLSVTFCREACRFPWVQDVPKGYLPPRGGQYAWVDLPVAPEDDTHVPFRGYPFGYFLMQSNVIGTQLA